MISSLLSSWVPQINNNVCNPDTRKTITFSRSIKMENKVLLKYIQIFYIDKIFENVSLLPLKALIKWKARKKDVINLQDKGQREIEMIKQQIRKVNWVQQSRHPVECEFQINGEELS